MTQTDANRRPWWKGRRSAALAAGLAATLALSPLVWAETDSSPSSGNTSIPTPQISQQSFAPLVKKVLPAVVNISVTEKPTADDQMSDQSFDTSPGDNNSPFDEFLRRFFEQHGGNGQSVPREFGGHPNDQEGVKRIALGSGFIIDPAGYIVTNNHVVGRPRRFR